MQANIELRDQGGNVVSWDYDYAPFPEGENGPTRARGGESCPGTLPICGDRTQHFLFELGAHARQLAQLLVAAETLQLIDGADAVVLEDERNAFGSQTLDLQEFKSGGRKFLQQHIAAVTGTRLNDLANNLGETFADLDTPLSIYLKLANKPYSYLLESVLVSGMDRAAASGITPRVPAQASTRVTGHAG